MVGLAAVCACCSLKFAHLLSLFSVSLPPPQVSAGSGSTPLQALEQRHRGITSVWRWLQENRPRFRGAVYGPIAVEVDCPDSQHVQYLEQHVGGEWGLAGWLASR